MTESVLLGVADARVEAKDASWQINKIGGIPDWMEEWSGSPPCNKCGKAQSLVFQLYCPLENSKFHRTIYIFCCVKKDCWTTAHGWSALRMQCKETRAKRSNVKLEHKTKPMTWGDADDEWGDADDEWGEADDEWGEADDQWGVDDLKDEEKTSAKEEQAFLTDTRKALTALKLDPPEQPSGSYSSGEPEHVFESFYVNVFDEPEANSNAEDDEHIQELIDKYHQTEEKGDDLPDLRITAQEDYEKQDVTDPNFHKFWKKCSKFPSQVIRYQWNGTPVLIKENDSPVPDCQRCGAKRIFECQLMPALVPHLQIGGEEIEFASVLIYSCSASCWKTVKPYQEYVMYCHDPDLKYFKSQSFKRRSFD